MVLTQTLGFIVGVASGVATAVILGLIKIAYSHIFIPWLDEHLYRGVNISGNWKADLFPKKEGGHGLKITMTLVQRAYSMSGTFQAVSNFGKEYVNQYIIEGKIIDNYLLLNYKPLSRSRIGLGNFILRVEQGGTELKGAIAFIAENTGNITSTNDTIFYKVN